MDEAAMQISGMLFHSHLNDHHSEYREFLSTVHKIRRRAQDRAQDRQLLVYGWVGGTSLYILGASLYSTPTIELDGESPIYLLDRPVAHCMPHPNNSSSARIQIPS